MIALTSDECLVQFIQATEEGEEKNSVGKMGIVEYFYLQHCDIFSRRMRWAGFVAHAGDEWCIQGFDGETSW